MLGARVGRRLALCGGWVVVWGARLLRRTTLALGFQQLLKFFKMAQLPNLVKGCMNPMGRCSPFTSRSSGQHTPNGAVRPLTRHGHRPTAPPGAPIGRAAAEGQRRGQGRASGGPGDVEQGVGHRGWIKGSRMGQGEGQGMGAWGLGCRRGYNPPPPLPAGATRGAGACSGRASGDGCGPLALALG